MKVLNSIVLSLVTVALLLSVTSCKKKSDDPKPEQSELVGTWVATDVSAPAGTATAPGDVWIGFQVVINETLMTTSGHPTGANAVWPSGAYTLSGSTISRVDDVDMTINSISATTMSLSFSIPDGVTTGRVAALDGQYTFNLAKQE
jgi:hypothetical protein